MPACHRRRSTIPASRRCRRPPTRRRVTTSTSSRNPTSATTSSPRVRPRSSSTNARTDTAVDERRFAWSPRRTVTLAPHAERGLRCAGARLAVRRLRRGGRAHCRRRPADTRFCRRERDDPVQGAGCGGLRRGRRRRGQHARVSRRAASSASTRTGRSWPASRRPAVRDRRRPARRKRSPRLSPTTHRSSHAAASGRPTRPAAI